jgi:hypothetical protein
MAGAGRHLLLDFGGDGFEVRSKIFKRARRNALWFATEAKKYVLGSDIFAAKPRGFFPGGRDDVPRAFGESIPHGGLTLSVWRETGPKQVRALSAQEPFVAIASSFHPKMTGL